MSKFIFALLISLTCSVSAKFFDPTEPKKLHAVNPSGFEYLQLKMIQVDKTNPKKHKAFINDKWYGIGDYIGQSKILKIEFNNITLTKNKKTVVLSLVNEL